MGSILAKKLYFYFSIVKVIRIRIFANCNNSVDFCFLVLRTYPILTHLKSSLKDVLKLTFKIVFLLYTICSIFV